MEILLSGVSVDVNEEGFMTNLDQWDETIALELAKSVEINELTDKHWEVIRFLQDQYKKEARLSIRSIGKSGVVSIKEFYALFPDGPLKKAAKISGIPKPASCI